MSRHTVDAMLAAGLLLAGAVMAVVLLEFRALGTIGQTVAIAALALLSVMLIWTAVRIGGRTGADDGTVSGLPDDSSSVGRVAEAPAPAIVVTHAAEEARADSEEEPSPDAAAADGRDDLERPRDSHAAVEPTTDTPVKPIGGVGGDGSVEPAPTAESSALPPAADPGSGGEGGIEGCAVDLQDYRKRLVGGWNRYRVHGDGHFNARGLEEQLSRSEIPANVRGGHAVKAEGSVLVVEHPEGDDRRFFVLPSFTKSPRAAPNWFQDAGDGALTRRTRTIHELAEGKWKKSQFAVIEKGRIE